MDIVYVSGAVRWWHARIIPSYARVKKLFRKLLRNCRWTLANVDAALHLKAGVVVVPLVFSSPFPWVVFPRHATTSPVQPASHSSLSEPPAPAVTHYLAWLTMSRLARRRNGKFAQNCGRSRDDADRPRGRGRTLALCCTYADRLNAKTFSPVEAS